jgi:hypothetical protein
MTKPTDARLPVPEDPALAMPDDPAERLLDEFARLTGSVTAPVWRPGRTRARGMILALLGTGLLVLGAAVVLARMPGSQLVGGGPSAEPSPSSSATSAPATPATPAPGAFAACPITRPTPAFLPPSIDFVPPTPPAYYHSSWYGNAHLWTMLNVAGEIWTDLPADQNGYGQKVFWWSADWHYQTELQPTLTVVGMRLDAPGSFTVPPPGTNAGADFGEAMLQGIDVPSTGCWRITGTYREASLSYVVWVGEVPSSAPSPSPELVDGLPVSIDGEPVLVGAAASSAIEASTDDTSFLVGGWLYNVGARTCTMALTNESPWITSCGGYHLLSRPMTGTAEIAVAQGRSSFSSGSVAEGSVLPIVLRVHTHDPSCPVSERIDCAHLAVLDELVWEGTVEPMPSPASTRPPGGLSQADAVAAALTFAARNSIANPKLVSATAGPYLDVAPPGADIPGDQWVWAIVVAGSFPPPDCATGTPTPTCLPNVPTQVVVLDYVTGSVVLAEAPAP